LDAPDVATSFFIASRATCCIVCLQYRPCPQYSCAVSVRLPPPGSYGPPFSPVKTPPMLAHWIWIRTRTGTQRRSRSRTGSVYDSHSSCPSLLRWSNESWSDCREYCCGWQLLPHSEP
jgi:hypothetical protein